MQFELTHNVTSDIVVVSFNKLSAMRRFTLESFYQSFHMIGGESQNTANLWHFPSFITSQIISEIIRNTCFVCGGRMKTSTAFQNTLVSFDDFGDDSNNRGTTQSRIGSAKQIIVRKCSECGHSHT